MDDDRPPTSPENLPPEVRQAVEAAGARLRSQGVEMDAQVSNQELGDLNAPQDYHFGGGKRFRGRSQGYGEGWRGMGQSQSMTPSTEFKQPAEPWVALSETQSAKALGDDLQKMAERFGKLEHDVERHAPAESGAPDKDRAPLQAGSTRTVAEATQQTRVTDEAAKARAVEQSPASPQTQTPKASAPPPPER